MVFPPQKPEPGIEMGIPEKVTKTSTQCGLSVVNKYLQRLGHSAGSGDCRVTSPVPALKQFTASWTEKMDKH